MTQISVRIRQTYRYVIDSIANYWYLFKTDHSKKVVLGLWFLCIIAIVSYAIKTLLVMISSYDNPILKTEYYELEYGDLYVPPSLFLCISSYYDILQNMTWRCNDSGYHLNYTIYTPYGESCIFLSSSHLEPYGNGLPEYWLTCSLEKNGTLVALECNDDIDFSVGLYAPNTEPPVRAFGNIGFPECAQNTAIYHSMTENHFGSYQGTSYPISYINQYGYRPNQLVNMTFDIDVYLDSPLVLKTSEEVSYTWLVWIAAVGGALEIIAVIRRYIEKAFMLVWDCVKSDTTPMGPYTTIV